MRSLCLSVVLLVALGCGPAPVVTPRPDAGSDAGAPTDAGIDSGVVFPGDGGLDTPLGEWAWLPVEGSVCGSGSTAGLGINRSANERELFLFVQGGGACWNQGTCVPSLLSYGPLCDYATTCLLDSAGGQKPTAVWVTHPDPFPRDGGGAWPQELNSVKASLALDRTFTGNPFREATYVFVPYCTGDLHAGSTDKTYQYKYGLFDQPKSYVMHFRGADNFDRYLARLKAAYPNVERIWLTGVSGGGYGASLNFDRVQRAFPGAEVHLLADSSPLVDTPHWVEWRDTWNLQFPVGCADCDAGLPKVMTHLAAQYPERRLALLSYDLDKVVAWFFYAPPGLANFLNPPTATFNANLVQLEARYDQAPNTKYFVIGGEEHVLWAGYGVRRPDGGITAPLPSRDGGTTLRAWIDAWATGDDGWESTR